MNPNLEKQAEAARYFLRHGFEEFMAWLPTQRVIYYGSAIECPVIRWLRSKGLDVQRAEYDGVALGPATQPQVFVEFPRVLLPNGGEFAINDSPLDEVVNASNYPSAREGGVAVPVEAFVGAVRRATNT